MAGTGSRHWAFSGTLHSERVSRKGLIWGNFPSFGSSQLSPGNLLSLGMQWVSSCRGSRQLSVLLSVLQTVVDDLRVNPKLPLWRLNISSAFRRSQVLFSPDAKSHLSGSRLSLVVSM